MQFKVDFQQAPLLLIWEVSRACALACQHCRASAIDWRDPRELSLEEGRRLIDDVAAMGTPLLVLTGGDPLQRDDLEDLIRHALSRHLTVGTIPAATPRLTRERVLSLKAAGVHQIALSVDAETAAKHDAFRGVPGTFDKVMEAAGWIRDAGINLQANTVFGAWNADDFDAIADLIQKMGVVFWEVFFLVPTGRGAALQSCSPRQFEQLFGKLYQLARQASFVIKVTEGQHLRRFMAQKDAAGAPDVTRARARMMLGGKPVNSGHGFCFVDHVGNVCPSGFLPLACGNVRETSVIDIYRNNPVFRELRQFELLKGKCGGCEYRDLCSGGSRARAYGLTGDYLAPEEFCVHEPQAISKPESLVIA
ncbi:MAG: TIGR04053 family radical SAM/SPASM domain-containing protein [Verrucomicrobia bacterium]|nr:TIGR04053 family radical SAM/SPASM domain-containing protein [Verrucomicrobiota bacterium]